MFDLSSKTKVDRRFRLAELYKMMAADKQVKECAKNILSIVLTNALSQETTNLPAGDKVKEIYIFNIELSSKEIPVLFISSLDKAINLHTVFVLSYGEDVMLYGCYKEKTPKGIKLGKYYSTEWAKPQPPVPLPLNVASMDDIYTFFISKLIPVAINQGETVSEFVARYEKITKLQKKIDKLKTQIANERQSHKRFELNDELRKVKKELEEVKNDRRKQGINN